MRAANRLLNAIGRQVFQRSHSETRAVSPLRNGWAYAEQSMSTAKFFSTVSAPSTPLRSSIAERAIDSVQTTKMLDGFDPVQVSLLEEECILVDESDQVVGVGSKKDCHLMVNIEKGLLHRAFSVFLFNSKGELLIQQRSDEKITFPNNYTNTCCSHPLATPSEQTENPIEGVKQAAQRRMYIELGIPPEELPLDCFHYLTRIKYKASSDGLWGEHEIDYILFVQKDIQVLRPNPNEIKSIRYLSKDEIDSFVAGIENEGAQLTPWFNLILQTFLKTWWDNLGNLEKFESHDTIHRLN